MKPKVTKWFNRSDKLVRHGYYECFCRIAGGAFAIWREKLYWDGIGFKVPIPMMVLQWRGLKKEMK